MRVVVTGGSGFIGTNLVERFASAGHDVVSLDIEPPRNPAHRPLWREWDVRDRDLVVRTFADLRPEAVLHMAARTDLDGRELVDYAANTVGVNHLIEALARLPAPPFTVFASSMLVHRLGHRPTSEADYGPTTVYGQSKVAGERAARAVSTSTLPWVIVRPTSVWGPWFATPYRDFFEAVSRGLYVHPRGRRIRRHYGFVHNAVHQLERLVAERGGTLLGRTVYLADAEPLEIGQWAGLICRTLGVRQVREAPLGLLRIAARVGDALRWMGMRQPPLTSFRLNNLLTDSLLDTQPLHELAGPDPYSPEEGVRITCDWLRGQRAAQAPRA